MEYARRRLRDKEYKRRKRICEVTEVQVAGIERCSRGRWRAGQR